MKFLVEEEKNTQYIRIFNNVSLRAGTCPSGEFKCSVSKECVDENLICNGQPDCTDETDEMECEDGRIEIDYLAGTLEFRL